MTAERRPRTRQQDSPFSSRRQMADSPLKVSRESHRVLRVMAATQGRTMGDVLDDAVTQFLAAHRNEIEAGFAHAREVLGA